MAKNKKSIPDVGAILDLLDRENKFTVSAPEQAKKKANLRTINQYEEEEEKLIESLFRDFNSVTIGDYINAAHVYNREMLGQKVSTTQEMAYFTLFAFEERLKRITEHYTYIN